MPRRRSRTEVVRLGAVLPAHQVEKLEAIADQQFSTRSAVMAEAIEYFLQNHPKALQLKSPAA